MKRADLISEECVDQVCRSIRGMTDLEEAARLSSTFAETQPALALFVLESTRDLSRDAVELAYYAALIIWLCFQRTYSEPLGEITPEAVKNHCEPMGREIMAILGGEERMVGRRILHSTDNSQPAVLKFIVESICECDVDGVQLTPGEEGRLFAILMTVADTLESVRIGAL